MFLEFLQDIHKVRQRAADAVQLIDDDLTDLPLADQLHHILEAVSMDITAGKAVVHKDLDLFAPFLRFHHRVTVFNLRLTADAVFPL